jgi:hypothetical protein
LKITVIQGYDVDAELQIPFFRHIIGEKGANIEKQVIPRLGWSGVYL